MQKPPIVIVGMARSGTTLVSHILGSLPNVHVAIEPHALWKSGNFKYFNDEEYDVSDGIVNNIRARFINNLDGKTLIEKSPINSLRPFLVHAVFPEAKIAYIERDAIRCIYSNYRRSIAKDSFKVSIILKKYFVYTGSKDLAGAISSRKLFQQISIKDIPDFIKYVSKMFYLRQVKGILPFGPKIKNFMEVVKEKGLLAYHVEVYKKSVLYKQKYKDLYGSNMAVFNMEDIMKKPEEIKRLIDFAGIAFNQKWAENIYESFNKERIGLAMKKREEDKQIESLLNV